MINIHTCEIVELARELYRDAPISKFPTTVELIESHAQILFGAHQKQEPTCTVQIRHWHPKLVSKPADEILAADFSLDDARLTICRELGYESFEDAKSRAAALDQEFEAAVDLALSGNITGLGEQLRQRPDLATQASSFGHAATLLIYLAANGVEMWRQVVPSNVVEVAGLLIEAGADRRAAANVYGGQFDAFALAESSAHPHEAGVAKELLAVLR